MNAKLTKTPSIIRSAEQAKAVHAYELEALLENIQHLQQLRAELQSKSTLDWRDVGTVRHVNEQLNNLLAGFQK